MSTSWDRTRTFFVEAYLPAAEQVGASAIGARMERAAAALQSVGTPIEFVSGHVLPDDEIAFYVFSAETREVVETALASAGVRFDRIAESIPLTIRGSPNHR